eukprot:6225311-Pyramimonas_sp.AAC.1
MVECHRRHASVDSRDQAAPCQARRKRSSGRTSAGTTSRKVCGSAALHEHPHRRCETHSTSRAQREQ